MYEFQYRIQPTNLNIHWYQSALTDVLFEPCSSSIWALIKNIIFNKVFFTNVGALRSSMVSRNVLSWNVTSVLFFFSCQQARRAKEADMTTSKCHDPSSSLLKWGKRTQNASSAPFMGFGHILSKLTTFYCWFSVRCYVKTRFKLDSQIFVFGNGHH